MEGRRHGRGWGKGGDAGGCGARARRHVPSSGGCRRGAGGEGRESQSVGPLRELFHVRLASGGVTVPQGYGSSHNTLKYLHIYMS